jgi:hypothetical protein
MNPRALLVIIVAALAAAFAFGSPAAHAAMLDTAAPVETVTLSPYPFGCLLDDPRSCGLQLPPDANPHPGSGGGTHHVPANNDKYCAEQKAALGPAADTELGKFHLSVLGCE